MNNTRQRLDQYRSSGVRTGLLAGLVMVAVPAAAIGPVLEEDLSARSLCVGANCVTGATAPTEIRLQDDTVRLRFIDSTASNTTAEGLGESWGLLANDPDYGAESYFGITLRSIDPAPGAGGNDIVGRHMLRLAPATPGTHGGGAFGHNSALINGVVSLGYDNGERRLVHVAQATEPGDALTKRQLDEGLLGPLGEIADRLDELEIELATLERRAASGSSSGSSGSGKNGGGGAMGIATLALLALWLGRAGKRQPVRNA